MELAASEVNTFLKGIENHARAGNFDQASIQTRILLDRLEAAIQDHADASFEFRKALPLVRQVLEDSSHSDSRSVIGHLHQAQLALGFSPE